MSPVDAKITCCPTMIEAQSAEAPLGIAIRKQTTKDYGVREDGFYLLDVDGCAFRTPLTACPWCRKLLG